MKSSNETIYYLIFDTNALFQAYEKKADFTTFSFNATYENVIDMINKLDIYNQVTVQKRITFWLTLLVERMEAKQKFRFPMRMQLTEVYIVKPGKISKRILFDFLTIWKISIQVYLEMMTQCMGFLRILRVKFRKNASFRKVFYVN